MFVLSVLLSIWDFFRDRRLSLTVNGLEVSALGAASPGCLRREDRLIEEEASSTLEVRDLSSETSSVVQCYASLLVHSFEGFS